MAPVNSIAPVNRTSCERKGIKGGTMVVNTAVRVKCATPEASSGNATSARSAHCFQPKEDTPLRPSRKHAPTVTIRIAVVMK